MKIIFYMPKIYSLIHRYNYCNYSKMITLKKKINCRINNKNNHNRKKLKYKN